MIVCNLGAPGEDPPRSNPRNIWNVKRDGKTDWERIVEGGSRGWELVAVTPEVFGYVSGSGTQTISSTTGSTMTLAFIYTFKRPIPA